jgi:hypothetical protein
MYRKVPAPVTVIVAPVLLTVRSPVALLPWKFPVAAKAAPTTPE